MAKRRLPSTTRRETLPRSPTTCGRAILCTIICSLYTTICICSQLGSIPTGIEWYTGPGKFESRYNDQPYPTNEPGQLHEPVGQHATIHHDPFGTPQSRANDDGYYKPDLNDHDQFKSCYDTSFFRETRGAVERSGKMGIPNSGGPKRTVQTPHINENSKTNNRVINLSSTTPDETQIELLCKGLTFTPVPSFNEFNWVKDVNLFARKLALHKFHLSNNSIPLHELQGLAALEDLQQESTGELEFVTPPLTTLKPRSKNTPPISQYKLIDTFVELVTSDLQKLKDIRKPLFNLSKNENDGLKSLIENENLIIKPSDKGGNIVLMDRPYYVKMVNDLLGDRTTYEILPNNPTTSYVQELKLLLQGGVETGCINRDEYNFMFNSTPTIATFYALPKVHKRKSLVPGRPIVSGTDNLTQGISNYVDTLLRPLVTGLRSYLKDTKDTLTKINGITVSDRTILASLDIEALYSSIQHQLGLNAVQFFLDTKGIQFRKHNKFLLSLLQFILTHNYFTFEGKFYHQINGTAMGTNCAPTYANLFLGWWEDQIVFTEEYDRYTNHILFWGRYIDDVLILWDGDSHLFLEFVTKLNINLIGMKFTYEINPVELPPYY